jgi:DNA-binding HxlR family transcriptional regulator
MHPLQGAGVYAVLSNLNGIYRPRHTQLMRLVTREIEADAPLLGNPALPHGTKRLLHHLVESGLVERGGDTIGMWTRYEVSSLAAGMLWSLAPVAHWALEPKHFDAVVAAVRRYRGLPQLREPAADRFRHSKLAAGLVIQLLTPRWSRPVLEYMDSAGERGISPSKLISAINAAAEATSGKSRVEWRLTTETTHTVLRRLTGAGLLEKQASPPRVLYRLTPMGEGLTEALWEVARWGMAHEDALFQVMIKTSKWFPDAQPA